MKFFNNFSIRKKNIILLVTLQLLVGIMAALGIIGMSQIKTNIDLIQSRRDDSANVLRLLNTAGQSYSYQASLYLGGDAAAADKFTASADEMMGYLKNAKTAAVTPEEQGQAADLEKAANAYTTLFNDKILPAWKAKDTKQITQLDQESRQYLTAIQDSASLLLATFEQKAADAKETRRQRSNQHCRGDHWGFCGFFPSSARSLG